MGPRNVTAIAVFAWAGAAAAAEKREIKVPGWPDLSAKAPLSSGILARDRVLASGMVGLDFDTMRIVPGGVGAETKQALTLVGQILKAGGTDMDHVTGCEVYLKDMKDFAAMNEAYAGFFAKPRPTRVAAQIASLSGNASVEIKCSAALPPVSRKEIKVPGWPDLADKFPFSTGILSGNFVFASGMQGIDMKVGKLVQGGVQAETKQTLSNIKAVVEAAGVGMDDVVDCAVYLMDMKDFKAVNEVYTTFFSKPQPSRVAFQVGALAGGATVEIQCFAALAAAGRTQVVVPGWPDMKMPFSNGIAADGRLFASGLAGFDMPAMRLVGGGVANETRQALSLVSKVLEAGGSSMAEVLSCNVYLRDLKDFAVFNAVYSAFFPKPCPARVAMQIAGLVQGAAVEVQCEAALPAQQTLIAV